MPLLQELPFLHHATLCSVEHGDKLSRKCDLGKAYLCLHLLHYEWECKDQPMPTNDNEGKWGGLERLLIFNIKRLCSGFYHTAPCVLLKVTSWLGRPWKKPVNSIIWGQVPYQWLSKSGMWQRGSSSPALNHTVAPAAAPLATWAFCLSRHRHAYG